MKCPFCGNNVRLKDRTWRQVMWGGLTCTHCHATMEAGKIWKDADGVTLLEKRLAVMPARVNYRGFEVTDRGYGYQELQSFENIQHLRFFWLDTNVKETINWIPSGGYHEHTAVLEIEIGDRNKKIRVKAGVTGPWLDLSLLPGGVIRGLKVLASHISTGMSAKEQCESLFMVSRLLHHHTFNQRLKKYFEEYNKAGCFVYENIIFQADGTVREKNKTFNIHTAIIEFKPYALIIGEPRRTLAHHWSGNEITVPLALDQDVFCAMILRLYNINLGCTHPSGENNMGVEQVSSSYDPNDIALSDS